MKRILKLILISVYCCALGPAIAGTEINNGGAGISINGEVATFYSAQLRVNPTPLRDVPSLNTLTNLVRKFNIPKNVKMELAENIKPSFDRKYYAVAPETINQTTLQLIKEEYSKLTKTPPDQITIFALTDPESKITLLLPDFFKLNEDEKVAILFHESLWINRRVKNYADMLEIEKDMQILSMYPTECVPLYNLTKKIESIFGEKFWSINTIFKCQTDKYHIYSNADSVAMTDFFNSSEMSTLAQIILTRLPNRPSNAELYELLSKQINEPTNLKIFSASKNAFVQTLKDDELEITVIYKNNMYPNDPFASEFGNSVNALVKLLNKMNFYYDFYNTDIFNLSLSNPGTAESIKITINYKK